jgi:hypothetical protein
MSYRKTGIVNVIARSDISLPQCNMYTPFNTI